MIKIRQDTEKVRAFTPLLGDEIQPHNICIHYLHSIACSALQKTYLNRSQNGDQLIAACLASLTPGNQQLSWPGE